MATPDEWSAALSRFPMKDEHRAALAGHMAATQVPVGHISALSGIRVSSKLRPGAGALYHPASRTMQIADPTGAARVGPGVVRKYQRTLSHEIGHHVSQVMNGPQFGTLMQSEGGRARLEASAENYADQAVPGSYSGYDYESAKGRMHPDYAAQRGARYGNVDPRLKNTAA